MWGPMQPVKIYLQVDTETHAAVTGVYEEAFTWKYDSETLASAHSITLLTGAGYTDAASRGKELQIQRPSLALALANHVDIHFGETNSEGSECNINGEQYVRHGRQIQMVY